MEPVPTDFDATVEPTVLTSFDEVEELIEASSPQAG